MPNVKSAKKRVKTNERDRVKNKIVKTRMKKAIKKVSKIISAETLDLQELEAAKKDALKIIGRTAGVKTIDKKKAARLESRLMKRLNKATAAGAAQQDAQ